MVPFSAKAQLRKEVTDRAAGLLVSNLDTALFSEQSRDAIELADKTPGPAAPQHHPVTAPPSAPAPPPAAAPALPPAPAPPPSPVMSAVTGAADVVAFRACKKIVPTTDVLQVAVAQDVYKLVLQRCGSSHTLADVMNVFRECFNVQKVDTHKLKSYKIVRTDNVLEVKKIKKSAQKGASKEEAKKAKLKSEAEAEAKWTQ